MNFTALTSYERDGNELNFIASSSGSTAAH
jgi:hypothetical protein